MTDKELLQVIKEAARKRASNLDLSNKGLTKLPEHFAQLANLQELDLSCNQLTELPLSMANLSNLRWLNLFSNRLTDLPTHIAQLSDLLGLDLADNRLTELPAHIAKLAKLQELDLADNQLTELPTHFAQLSKLQNLDLSGNQLTELPVHIAQLNLCILDLSRNQLSELPSEITQLSKLQFLLLHGNPLKDPPPEIAQQGTEAVLAYLRAKLEKTQRRWASKLLVVGQGGVGKTCLLRALQGKSFQHQDTTHGIRIRSLALPHSTEGLDMTLKCWDFGGQQIYHATHQFFLTNRSLFLLVWSARSEFEDARLNYWLESIRARAPQSPVILVATHLDQCEARLPLEEIRRQYPQVVGFFQVSNTEGTGLAQLKQALSDQAAQLPLMGESWPAKWLEAAEDLRNRPDRSISLQDLGTILSEHGVQEDSQLVLTRWLHELGDLLHLEKDPELKDIVLLDSEWVTRNVSRALSCRYIELGIFKRAQMGQVWPDLDPAMRERFLRLMEAFDLSYRIPDDPEHRSLVVEQLSHDPPEGYSERWEAMLQNPGCREVSMTFDLGIPRPPGIPTWFIARSHRFTTATHWLFGAVLQDREQKHLGLVHAPPTEESILRLIVRGPHPYNFFALLKDGLEVTLERYPGVKITRTVPCPGSYEQGSKCDFAFDVSDLERRLQRRQPKRHIECHRCEARVEVTRLLFGIDWEASQSIVRHHLEAIVAGEVEKGTRRVLDQIADSMAYIQRGFSVQFGALQRLEESHCPPVFTLRPERGKWCRKILGQKWKLQLYCEYPGCWHPTWQGGCYTIKDLAKWQSVLVPHLRRLVQVLKFVAPIVGPWTAVSQPRYETMIKKELALTRELVSKLPDIQPKASRRLQAEAQAIRAEGADLRGIRALLDDLDPKQHWGLLRKILTPEGHYLWLCEHHAGEFLN